MTIGARAVIRDPGGRILLIQRNDNSRWALPAGTMELGQTLRDCAIREVYEETGLTARTWRDLARIDLSNSVTDERARLFVATDLEQGVADPEPTESLAVRWLPFDEALAMTLDGRITDCLSVIAIQRIALERVRG